MAKRKQPKRPSRRDGQHAMSASVDDLLLAAQQRGDESLETGRYIITFKQDAREEAAASLGEQSFRVADARDFDKQAVSLADVGDADAVYFPELGVAAVSGDAFKSSGLGALEVVAEDSPIEAIEPEYFAFAENTPDRYLRGFRRAAQVIEEDLRLATEGELEEELQATVLGATWGLVACRVPPSTRSGLGIRTAVLDTGFDLGHPDFAGRAITSSTFVGQPVQDLHGHGTHTAGTTLGPLAPSGTTPRYGIAHRGLMFIGKVLSNSGSGSTASVLAGMNWAIANSCAVINMSLGAVTPVQAAYTAAGAAALNRGLLIVAAAGNHNGPTGAPANSPTILAVASVDNNLRRSAFSGFGKIEIAGPGRDVFSSVPRPTRYGIKSGTSMATPHVAGCGALWAQTSPTLRGMALWRKLQATARPLTDPPAQVGSGLVQAPA
jgi:subtilisin family serine protease